MKIQIFRAGKHTDMNKQNVDISANEIQEIAKAYDPKIGTAPLVIGHPKADKPAYGWVQSLHVEGTSLFANVIDLASDFVAQVKEGRYRKISASFFTPASPSNPKPGQYYLKHVGFLGAAAPAVPGMVEPSFSSDDDGLCAFEMNFSAQEMDYKARYERLQNDMFLEDLINKRRFLPCNKADTLEFMASIDDQTALSFSDGEKSALDWLKGYLSLSPICLPDFGQVDMSNSILGDEHNNLQQSSFSMPAGYKVSAEGMERMKRAAAFAEKNNVSFADAEIATRNAS